MGELTITIDGRPMAAREGETILQVARRAGLPIPTVCYITGLPPSVSCMACLVKVDGGARMVPSCGTEVRDGMQVASETEEVETARRMAVDLLLSEHTGDCLAPCTTGCPSGADIPLMIRHIHEGNLKLAAEAVIGELALPASVCRVCPAPCENACRRNKVDQPLSIALLVRRSCDALLFGDGYPSYQAPRRPYHVGIVGGGPAGLSAAAHLLRAGIPCTLHEAAEQAGGQLRKAHDTRAVDAEIAALVRDGLTLETGRLIDDPRALLERFDAVFVATGDGEGLPRPDVQTLVTSVPGLFVGGTLLRPTKPMAVRSAHDGRIAAASIAQHLAGEPVRGLDATFSSRLGRLREGELPRFLAAAPSKDARVEASIEVGLSPEEALAESGRCMHCDCRAVDDCQLRAAAQMLGCAGRGQSHTRPEYVQQDDHPTLVFEPGKCVKCGHCVRLAAEAGEEVGLAFKGRGYDMKLGVPFEVSLSSALRASVEKVVAACPTGALALR